MMMGARNVWVGALLIGIWGPSVAGAGQTREPERDHVRDCRYLPPLPQSCPTQRVLQAQPTVDSTTSCSISQFRAPPGQIRGSIANVPAISLQCPDNA